MRIPYWLRRLLVEWGYGHTCRYREGRCVRAGSLHGGRRR